MTKQAPRHDTPGRPKQSSSRQQIVPDQATQTGSPQIDRASPQSKPKTEYKDRPADEGKHGYGDQEPNEGFPER